MIYQFRWRLSFNEIPENPFRQTCHGGGCFTGKPHGNIIAWQHDLCDPCIICRFVFLYPRQLGRREVSRVVQQFPHAEIGTKLVESWLAVCRGTAVAPDNRLPDRLAGGIHSNKAMHLIGDANSLDIFEVSAFALHNPHALHYMMPPHIRVLLSPPGLRCIDA